MNKIEKGTHKGLFDWLLESENNATFSSNNSAMIRVLVREHNNLVDAIKDIQEKSYQKGFEEGYDHGLEDCKQNIT